MAALKGIRAVLFDLDGTLVDTAPDLGHVLNLLLARHDLPPLPDTLIRPQASHGTQGLIGLGFGVTPDDPRFAPLRDTFLTLYAACLCERSRPFDGIPELLDDLEARGLKWGVVTNKPARFTEPLLACLNLHSRAACIISGDTCAHPKPHPAPMLEAARQCGVAPAHCLYLGDAQRDIEAGRAAGMPAFVAGWGYLDATDQPETWGAHGILTHPDALRAEFALPAPSCA